MKRGFMEKIIFLIIMISSLNLLAAEYFVATNGNDSNPGTKAAPFKTIQKGVNTAKNPGDIISVRGGTYAGSVVLKYSGASGKPITLRSFPGEKAKIDQGPDLANTAAKFLRVILDGGSTNGVKNPIGWLIIDGLEITRGNEGIKMYKAHDVIIRNCNIHHNISMGFLGNGTRVTIDRNIIANNGFTHSLPNYTIHGIYLSGTTIKITNNIIHSNICSGIQVAGYTTNYGAAWYGAKYWLIANNTFAVNKGCAAILLYKSLTTDNLIVNNIFYNNNPSGKSNGVSFVDSGPRNTIKYNLFYSATNRAPFSFKVPVSHTATNNLTQINPKFRSPATFDFRLPSDSPAINEGMIQTSVKTDLLGLSRPLGGAYDIGAYEYTGSSSSLSAPSSVSNLRIND